MAQTVDATQRQVFLGLRNLLRLLFFLTVVGLEGVLWIIPIERPACLADCQPAPRGLSRASAFNVFAGSPRSSALTFGSKRLV